MITAVSLVPKGVARRRPLQDDAVAMDCGAASTAPAAPREDEDGDDPLDVTAAVEHARVAQDVLQSAGQGAGSNELSNAMRGLRMEAYDQEDDDILSIVLKQGAEVEVEGDDPYLLLPDEMEDHEADEIRESDLLVLCAKAEEDAAALEMMVFEEPDEQGDMNAYVHHSIPLFAYPLSLDWVGCSPHERDGAGNFAALSTVEPGIDVWNLDVIDSMEPTVRLGGEKPKSKAGGLKAGSHKDSVLSVAWNPQFRAYLASGSADKSIKVWDLHTQKCVVTCSKCHKDKVQVVSWNPHEQNVMLSGGYDKRVCLTDVRVPDRERVPRWMAGGEVEDVKWNPHETTEFAVATDDGHVKYFDTRAGERSPPVFTLKAHDTAACALAFNPQLPGRLLTGSLDKTVKLWTTEDATPQLAATQNVGVGAVFRLSMPQDSENVVVVGGMEGACVWDLHYHQDALQALRSCKSAQQAARPGQATERNPQTPLVA